MTAQCEICGHVGPTYAGECDRCGGDVVTSRPTYSDGLVHVLAEKCSTCIFRPGNPMTLAPGRVKSMVNEALAEEGGTITCHKTLPGMPGEAQQAICRGFYDAHGGRSTTLTLAERLGIIKEVPAP